MLLEMIELNWAMLSPYLHIYRRTTENNNPVFAIEIHQEILDGIKTGNSSKAVKWLRKDIETAAKRVIDMFDKSKTHI